MKIILVKAQGDAYPGSWPCRAAILSPDGLILGLSRGIANSISHSRELDYCPDGQCIFAAESGEQLFWAATTAAHSGRGIKPALTP
jgi:hypothetical protein